MSLIFTLGLFVLTYLILKGGWITPNRKFKISFSMESIVLAAISIAAAMWFFGPITGVALVAIIAIHEFGHVAAYRVCGHDDATFRLIPLMGGVASSSKAPDGPLHSFFISIMGPAICIAPTLLALELVYGGYDMPDLAREFLWSFGIFSGVINFFNLLPIGPLDGGKISRVLFEIFWPKAAKPFGIAMMGLALIAGAYMQSYFIIILTLMSFPSVMNPPEYVIVRKPSKRQGLMLLAAYVFCLVTLLKAGIPLILSYA
jgi:Zn-dependent protease